MGKRALHRIAHPGCPHANWEKCDLAEKVKYGQCKSVVGDREPTPCTRWAVAADGWCWQHYASELEKQKRSAREAQAQLQLQTRISAHIKRTEDDPWFWVEKLTPSALSTRGLPPYGSDGAGGESNPAFEPPWGEPADHSAPRERRLPHRIG